MNTETGLPWMTYWAGESSIFKLSPNMVKFSNPQLFDSVMLGTVESGSTNAIGNVGSGLVAKLTAPPPPTTAVNSASNSVANNVTKAVNANNTANATTTSATQTSNQKPIINVTPTSKYSKPTLKKKSAATKQK